ncbi:MAG: T9SS type A sorting domain-containing protein [Bacteroidota bacterium]
MTRILSTLLLALAVGWGGAAAAQTDRLASPDEVLEQREGPIRAASLDQALLLATDGRSVRLAPGTYSTARLDGPIRLVADGGTVRLTGSGTVLSAEVPTEAAATTDAVTALGDPFPNPARGTATVPLTLGTDAEVDVRVFDALGRQVAALATGPRAAGTYDLPLVGADLAPGLYVVRATIRPDGGPDATQTRRLTIVR